MDFNILDTEKNGEFQRESHNLCDKTELTPHKQNPRIREDHEDWFEKVTSIDEFNNRQPIRLSLSLQDTTSYAHKGRHEDSDSSQPSQFSKDKHPSKYKSLVLAVLFISCVITLCVGLTVIFIHSNRNHDRLETEDVSARAEGEISINQTFTQGLNQTNSTVYQDFRKQFSNVMEESLREDFKLDRKCEIINLRKGSIVVRFVLFLEIGNKDVTPESLESAIRKSFKSQNGGIYLGIFPVIRTSLSIFNITKETKIRHSSSTSVHSSATRLPFKTTILVPLNSVNPLTETTSTDPTVTSIKPLPTTKSSSSATQIGSSLFSTKPTSSKFNGTKKTSGTFIPTASSSATNSTTSTSSTSFQTASSPSAQTYTTQTSNISIPSSHLLSTSKLHSSITSIATTRSSGTPTTTRMTIKTSILESTSTTPPTFTTPTSISANKSTSSSGELTSVSTGNYIEPTFKTLLPSAPPPTGLSSCATTSSTVSFSAFSRPSINTPTFTTTTSSASISTSTSSGVAASLTPISTASSSTIPFSSTPSPTTLTPNASSPKGLSSNTPIPTPTCDASTLSGSSSSKPTSRAKTSSTSIITLPSSSIYVSKTQTSSTPKPESFRTSIDLTIRPSASIKTTIQASSTTLNKSTDTYLKPDTQHTIPKITSISTVLTPSDLKHSIEPSEPVIPPKQTTTTSISSTSFVVPLPYEQATPHLISKIDNQNTSTEVPTTKNA